jgi:hypothetical protein
MAFLLMITRVMGSPKPGAMQRRIASDVEGGFLEGSQVFWGSVVGRHATDKLLQNIDMV